MGLLHPINNNVKDCFAVVNTLCKIVLWVVCGLIVDSVVDNAKRSVRPHRIRLWTMWIMLNRYIAKGCIFVVLIRQML